MTQRHRDFGKPVLPDTMEPVSFTIYDQTFQCYKQVNGITLMRFVREASSENGARATEALLDIFSRVMNKDEYARFIELCESPDTVVPMNTLSDIISYLIELYTGNPTSPSEG